MDIYTWLDNCTSNITFCFRRKRLNKKMHPHGRQPAELGMIPKGGIDEALRKQGGIVSIL